MQGSMNSKNLYWSTQ